MVLCICRELWERLSVAELAALSRLGASAAAGWRDGVTHVVATSLRRTERLMCAVCRGVHIVTPGWVSASLLAGSWAEELDHVVRDAEVEARLGSTLLEALARARRRPLLLGRRVYFTDSVEGAVRKAAVSVVLAAGGRVLAAPSEAENYYAWAKEARLEASDIIIVDAPASTRPSALPASRPIGGPRYAPQFLFEAALSQRLCFEAHCLTPFGGPEATTPPR